MPPLCRALGAMHHRYPTVALRILSTPLGASIDALLEGRCDLAISGIDLVHPAVELESLLAVRRAAVASACHPLARLEEQQLDGATLSDHVQIVVEDSSERTRDRDFGVVSTLRWRVADNLTKHTLIVAGMGWGSLPLWMIDRELQAGVLVRLPVAAFCEGGNCGSNLLGASSRQAARSGRVGLQARVASRTRRPLAIAAQGASAHFAKTGSISARNFAEGGCAFVRPRSTRRWLTTKRER
ncbi:substrate-binding domain-containing protein [Luteimonas salinilitoris]|uniref:Substrate-binding domain-containing protein n=1 Tax=Luteimonas salinilitoris TaxID=3237697 RepID=A0ABV4HK06_9GAMM